MAHLGSFMSNILLWASEALGTEGAFLGAAAISGPTNVRVRFRDQCMSGQSLHYMQAKYRDPHVIQQITGAIHTACRQCG